MCIRLTCVTFALPSPQPVHYCGNTSWRHFNGRCYLLVKDKMPADPAQAYCENLGGHLVGVRSQAENNFVASMIGSHNLWIGYYKTEQPVIGQYKQKWAWYDTTRDSRYKNWAPGEPNGLGGHYHARGLNDKQNVKCAVIWKFRSPAGYINMWDDRDCGQKNHFVCEKGEYLTRLEKGRC